MDVYIKGMEMPSCCMFCPISNSSGCGIMNPPVLMTTKEMLADRPDWCPLVSVPPHGRLIDADALSEDLKRQCEEVFKIDAVSPDDFWITRNQAYNERLWKTWCESFYRYLESRPTIIPAEGEEGE